MNGNTAVKRDMRGIIPQKDRRGRKISPPTIEEVISFPEVRRLFSTDSLLVAAGVALQIGLPLAVADYVQKILLRRAELIGNLTHSGGVHYVNGFREQPWWLL